MIEAIFGAIGDAITSFAGILGNGFQSILDIFFDSEAGYSPTPVGTLALIGVGIGLVFWAYRLVRGLMRVR